MYEPYQRSQKGKVVIQLSASTEGCVELGVRIPVSSALDRVVKGFEELLPLWELPGLISSRQKYLLLEETLLKAIDWDNKNEIHQGYMWL
jgi:hypothetical protein